MITIAYLYYDLLNLYGESGNIKALKKSLEEQGVRVSIHFLTLDDDLDFSKYDFVYMGAGTENNQNLILPHLMKYREDIQQQIEDGKFFLITGNAINLFGKYILNQQNKKIKTLGIFNYYSKEESFRMIDECIMRSPFFSEKIIGFQNQSTVMKENDLPMFEVIKGVGSYPNSKIEGVHYKNFYGTYLIGPILVRNPFFLKKIVKEVLLNKYPDYKFKKFDLKLQTKAYNNYNKNFNHEYIK